MRLCLVLIPLLAITALHAAPEPKPEPKPAPAKPEPGKPEPKPEPQRDPKPEPKPEPPPAPSKPSPTPPSQPPATPAPTAQTPAPAVPAKTTTTTTTTSAPKRKSVAEFTKDFKRVDGLFRTYLDHEKGGVWLYVAKNQVGPEFIYFNHSVDGPVAAGHNRGRYGDSIVIRLRRIFDRVEVIAQNTGLYFDPQNALSRAAIANVSPAILASENIVADDADGLLISATNLFLRETLTMVKQGGDRSLLGRLSEPKTKILRINGYPQNTAVIAEYVYENPNPSGNHDEDITDPRYVTVQVQHTLIAMPENDFKPRIDDPRIGYFTHQITDMTSTDAAPYRDVIHRWNLVKQKPGTKLSEPVDPIVFWIENTTPIEFRDTIRTAVLKWNEAFETAGFKDAVVVKVQPDDAKWDAGDIEHNVLRWTSSVNPPFGGYGPSFANPRTGQILGADIMLEYSYITKRLLTKKLFDDLGLATEQDDGASSANPHACLACNCARQGIQFGQTMLRLQKSDRIEVDRLVKESLYYLALHEVGHTLGLNHNFRSSHLHSPENIHNAEITEKIGLTGSVMDYPPVNIAPKGVKQGQYFTTKPGPYDHWVINYGYSEALEDPVEEQKRLDEIAGQSHKPELAFANDADDMRGIGKAIDPRAMLFDMSSDPITYGEQRCEMVKAEMKNILKDVSDPGKSWQEVGQAYMTLTKDANSSLTAISRYIGGVYVERAVQGQADGVLPFKPVEGDKQRRALQALAKHAFTPDTLAAPPELYAHLQQQRRGFDHGDETEDPKLHDIVFRMQTSLLSHILHSLTLQRIQDSALYGNEVSVDEVLSTLTTAICTGDDPAKPVSTMRQNLQLDYLTRLLNIAHNSGYYHATQSSALLQIERIKNMTFANTPAHQLAIKYRIRRALDEK
jgi:hypothetical protein